MVMVDVLIVLLIVYELFRVARAIKRKEKPLVFYTEVLGVMVVVVVAFMYWRLVYFTFR